MVFGSDDPATGRARKARKGRGNEMEGGERGREGERNGGRESGTEGGREERREGEERRIQYQYSSCYHAYSHTPFDTKSMKDLLSPVDRDTSTLNRPHHFLGM